MLVTELVTTCTELCQAGRYTAARAACDRALAGSESRQLKDGRFVLTNLLIHYGRYQLLFFGAGKRATLSGFVYSLPETL